jgi:hypothetical protein
MQAIFRGTYWLWVWALLQRDDEIKESFRSASRKLDHCVGAVCFLWIEI